MALTINIFSQHHSVQMVPLGTAKEIRRINYLQDLLLEDIRGEFHEISECCLYPENQIKLGIDGISGH